MLDINKIRKDFPMLENITNCGKKIVYFDNSATTLKPQCVIDSVVNYYQNISANVHRGDYDAAHKVDVLYEEARNTVAKFINAKTSELVFTYGTTSSLNMVAFGLKDKYVKEGDEIIISQSEHASNILPWYRLCDEVKAKIVFVELDEEGKLTIENLKKAITPKTKVISLAHVSNVLGYVLDIKKIAKIAHDNGALLVVDGAQSVAHMPIDVKDLDCDFYAFSAHKMCGPSGVGALYGKYELLENMSPLILGGGSNSRFDNLGHVYYKKAPYKFEAGTPPIEGVIGFKRAVEYLEEIGMENIKEYETYLHDYALNKLKEIKEIKIYNPKATSAIISFNYEDVFAQDLGTHFNGSGVALRTGQHCAKLLPNVLHTNSTVRASFYFYNTTKEIDEFIEVAKKGKEYLDVYFK